MSTVASWPTMAPGLDGQPRRQTPRFTVSKAWMRGAAEDLWNVPRYCFKYCVGVLAILGMSQIWQANGDGPIATFRHLSPESGLVPARVSSPHCMQARTDAATRKAALAPALAILDQVHPDVADWIRKADRRGKLLFTDSWKMGREGYGCLARHDALRGTLTISPGVFAESDGRIATILCHEYRHSRQRLSKTLLYALSFVMVRDGDPAIVENDALLFEQEAHLAVFGTYLEP